MSISPVAVTAHSSGNIRGLAQGWDEMSELVTENWWGNVL